MKACSTPKILSYTAGADLSAKQYYAVKFHTVEGQVVLYDGSGVACGILQNAPTSGQAAEVASFGGGAKWIADAGISAGDLLTSGSDGKAEVAIAGSTVYGIADAMSSTDSAASDVIPVILDLGLASDSQETITDVTVTSAELLALNATPKQLLAAAPAGKFHLIKSVEFFMDYVSAAYAGIASGEDLQVGYATAGIIGKVETTGWLDATADSRRLMVPGLGDATFLGKVGVAEAVNLSLLTGEITTGDSNLKVRVRSRLITALT